MRVSQRESRRKTVLVASLAGLLLVVGCAGGPSPTTAPGMGWSQTGVASWYGPGFHGRTTANGETYDMDAMTAAHKELPFNTLVRVESMDTGRTVEVRINDRGPFVDGRIIDLSRAAARQIEMIGSGTARVRVIVIRVSDLLTCSTVQIGAFADRNNVQSLLDRMRAAGEPVFTEEGPDGLTRVVLGPYPSMNRANEARARHGGYLRSCK
jgi:rare lipoprotein A